MYLVGIHHRLSVEADVLLGFGTVCSKDEADVLEQDSASRRFMTYNVRYDAIQLIFKISGHTLCLKYRTDTIKLYS